jgi:hypothetical protein
MDTYTCPKGHSSTEPDFCSECGARIQAAASPPSPPAPAQKCPECGAHRAADGSNFCEICGHNFATGAGGEIPPAPVTAEKAGPVREWTATVAVDPALREEGSPPVPTGVAPFTVDLAKPVSLIGRRSESRAVFPEIALNFDEAVSHRHALLQRGDDGTLLLRDIGATNGTRLNGKDVKSLVDIPLKDGDEITLGHWTKITVKAV